MGEAKRRGTYEQRVAQAIARKPKEATADPAGRLPPGLAAYLAGLQAAGLAVDPRRRRR